MSLVTFIKQQNSLNDLFGSSRNMIDVDNISQEQADALFSRLDSNLSPEVLYRDGEVGHTKAMKMKKFYTKAINELRERGFSVDLSKLYNYEG